jgi:RHS repeat-associated protein
VELEGRTVSGGYRFGFQNQEKDDEIKGEGSSINYRYRMYDLRLGKWFSVDPLAIKYPEFSPFNFCKNSPILFLDPDGKDIIIAVTSMAKKPDGAGSKGHMAIIVGNDKIGWHVFSIENIKNYDTYVKLEEKIFEGEIQPLEGKISNNTGVVFYHHEEKTLEDLMTYLKVNAPGAENSEENKGYGYDRFIKLKNTTEEDDEGFYYYLMGLTSEDYSQYEILRNNCSSSSLKYLTNFFGDVYKDKTLIDIPNVEFDNLIKNTKNWVVVEDLKESHDAERKSFVETQKTENSLDEN